MKKFYIMIFVFLLVTCIPTKTEFTTVAEEYECGEYYFYVEGEEEKGEFSSATLNGETTVLKCPIYLASSQREKIKGKILGESFSVSQDRENISELVKKLGAKVVSESKVDGIYSVYLYAGSLNANVVSLFGESVNMQIALSNGKMHVGFPVILGSY